MSHLVHEMAKVHIDDLHRQAADARRAREATGPRAMRTRRRLRWRPRLAFIRHGVTPLPARVRLR